ncbi:MAG: hypothetical protein ABFQ53_01520 [Patescibacteria group bacterium]
MNLFKMEEGRKNGHSYFDEMCDCVECQFLNEEDLIQLIEENGGELTRQISLWISEDNIFTSKDKIKKYLFECLPKDITQNIPWELIEMRDKALNLITQRIFDVVQSTCGVEPCCSCVLEEYCPNFKMF